MLGASKPGVGVSDAPASGWPLGVNVGLVGTFVCALPVALGALPPAAPIDPGVLLGPLPLLTGVTLAVPVDTGVLPGVAEPLGVSLGLLVDRGDSVFCGTLVVPGVSVFLGTLVVPGVFVGPPVTTGVLLGTMVKVGVVPGAVGVPGPLVGVAGASVAVSLG